MPLGAEPKGKEIDMAQIDAILAAQASPAPESIRQGIPRSFFIVAALLGACLIGLIGVAVLTGGDGTPTSSSQIGIDATPGVESTEAPQTVPAPATSGESAQ